MLNIFIPMALCNKTKRKDHPLDRATIKSHSIGQQNKKKGIPCTKKPANQPKSKQKHLSSMALFNKTEKISPLPQNNFESTQQPTKIKASKQKKDHHFHKTTSKITHKQNQYTAGKKKNKK